MTDEPSDPGGLCADDDWPGFVYCTICGERLRDPEEEEMKMCFDCENFTPEPTMTANQLSDREPHEFDGRYLWHPVPPGTSIDEQYDYLPLDVFRALEGYLPKSNPVAKDLVRSYPTREDAVRALLAAAAKAAAA